MANPPLKIQTLRDYAETAAWMARQLENSGHHEEAKQAQGLYRMLARVIAESQADRLAGE